MHFGQIEILHGSVGEALLYVFTWWIELHLTLINKSELAV